MGFIEGAATGFLEAPLAALGWGTEEGAAAAWAAGFVAALAAGLAAGFAAVAFLAGAALALPTWAGVLALDTGRAADLDGGLTGTDGEVGLPLAGVLTAEEALAAVFFRPAATADLAAFVTTLAAAFLGVVTSCLLAE